MNNGYIYIIKNDINNKVYIGQTSRDIYTRFSEHCFDKRSTSQIHKAIEELGYSHFKVELLETISVDNLDEREKYWIEYYDSYNNGYNSTIDGLFCKNYKGIYREYDQILVKESNIIFDSIEDMSRKISNITLWSSCFVKSKIKKAFEQEGIFFDYHLIKIRVTIEDVSDEDEQENWIKTLNIRYHGKHTHCIELDKDFDTYSSAAVYILENGYYNGRSEKPLQDLITSIGNNIKKGKEIKYLTIPLNFEEIPGMKKAIDNGPHFEGKKIYCPQLDMFFNSQIDAAKVFCDKKIWGNIVVKTAKSRIGDVVRGYFQSYKGYTFLPVNDNGEIIEPPLLKLQKPYLIKDNSIIEENVQKDIIKQFYSNILGNKKNNETKSIENKIKKGSWNTHKDLSDKYLELGSIGAVARFYNASRTTVAKACKEAGIHTLSQKEWCASISKPVYKIDHVSGEIVERYDSLTAAIIAVNGKNVSDISRAIEGNYSIYNYKWKWA